MYIYCVNQKRCTNSLKRFVIMKFNTERERALKIPFKEIKQGFYLYEDVEELLLIQTLSELKDGIIKCKVFCKNTTRVTYLSELLDFDKVYALKQYVVNIVIDGYPSNSIEENFKGSKADIMQLVNSYYIDPFELYQTMLEHVEVMVLEK